jgi:ribokinase
MKPATVYNLGSLNVDRVYRVPRIVRAGETLAASSLLEFAGGKGANQSVALARAGAHVVHIGKIGADGLWLRDRLAAEGIDTRTIIVSEAPTGQAIIQVDDRGENSIVLLAGANAKVTPDEIDTALSAAQPGDWLLVQNETSGVALALLRARQKGLHVAFNPAPLDARVADYPLECVDLLCVNETEHEALTNTLSAELPAACELLLSLGADGVLLKSPAGEIRLPACAVQAVDTTAAGDTLLGYYLAGLVQQLSPHDRLSQAIRAAALCVTRPGAMDSIPRLAEVQSATL